MKTYCLSLIVILFSLNLNSQENWVFLQTDLTGEYDTPENAISIVNKENHKVAILLQLKSKGRAYLLDDKQQIVNEIVVDKMPRKATIYSGHSISQNRYKVFFSNTTKKKISSITLNFGNNTYDIIENELVIKKENVLASFNAGNAFYVLSVLKNSNHFKLYTLGENGLISTDNIDLSHKEFVNDSDLKISLKSLFYSPLNSSTKVVDANEPSSLELASTTNKIYVSNDTLTISCDGYDKHTYIFKINLKSKETKVSKIDHPQIQESSFRIKSNSFILDNFMFGIVANGEKIKIRILNLETNEQINEFDISKKQPITIKNTPVILEGGEFTNYRELERTSQFIRKVMNSNIAISAYKYSNNYVLTIGGSKPMLSGEAAFFAGFTGGLVGAGLLATFGSYTKTKSTQFKSILNGSFEHIDGEVPLNGFDKIINFTKDLEKAYAPTVFKYQDNYIWGAFTKSAAFYRLAIF